MSESSQILLTLDELEKQISSIERFMIILDSDEVGRVYRPYRLRHGSPGSMKGRDLKKQIETLYPGIEAQVLSPFLTLEELRRRNFG